jgi:L-fuconolactonase
VTAAPVARIDAHHHLWDLARRSQPWLDTERMRVIQRTFGPSDLAAAVAGTGVGATVLVQVLNVEAETVELLEIGRCEPLVLGVVGWADLLDPAVPEDLDRLRRCGPLVGVRHQLQAEPSPSSWLARPELGRGLEALAAAGLAFELMIRPEQFDAALAVVRAHPEVRFVVDHLGKPPISGGRLEPWRTGLRRLARQPNVTAKLSGLVTMADPDGWTVAELRPWVDAAVEAFGPARLMFGSDWPGCLVAAEYAELVGAMETLLAELTLGEQRSVWSGTAAGIYGLG